MMTNLRDIFCDPTRRRCWLLSKALEGAHLDEALALAKGAEEFLTGRAGASEAVSVHLATSQLSTRIH
jgi:hypothetical protein